MESTEIEETGNLHELRDLRCAGHTNLPEIREDDGWTTGLLTRMGVFP